LGISNYASSFHGDAIQTSPFRELLASNGDWLLDKDASAACERVYQYITAGDTNCWGRARRSSLSSLDFSILFCAIGSHFTDRRT